MNKSLLYQVLFFTLFMWLTFALIDYTDAEAGVTFPMLLKEKVLQALLTGLGFGLIMWLVGKYRKSKVQ